MRRSRTQSETDRLLSNDPSSYPKRNSLTVRGWIIAVLVTVFVSLTAGSSLLGVFVRRAKIAHDLTRPRYRATQLISVTINTMGGSEEHGECRGDESTSSSTTGTCYLGNVHNVTEDVYHRLNVLHEILDRLKTNNSFHEHDKQLNKIDQSSNVLKIVLIPEFFFRGPDGAYSVDKLIGVHRDGNDTKNDGLLMQIDSRLKEMVVDHVFEDYLFVFGTVVAAHPLSSMYDDTNCSYKTHRTCNSSTAAAAAEMQEGILYYNFAFICKGGTNHSHYYIVPKLYISSGIDFLARRTTNHDSWGYDVDMDDAETYPKTTSSTIAYIRESLAQKGTTMVSGNLLEVDRIRLGVEICLEHLTGNLWKSILREQKQQQLQSQRHSLHAKHQQHLFGLVDVQLIVSAGISIESGPNPLKPGGVAYLSDGMGAWSAACQRANMDVREGQTNKKTSKTNSSWFDSKVVCRENPSDRLQHIPRGSSGYSDFVPPSACLDFVTFAEEEETMIGLLDGYYSLYQRQGCASTLNLYGLTGDDMMMKYDNSNNNNSLHTYHYYLPPSIDFYPTIDLPIVPDC